VTAAVEEVALDVAAVALSDIAGGQGDDALNAAPSCLGIS